MSAARRSVEATYAPEGLSRSEAARYLGLGPKSFEVSELTGDIPPPMPSGRWHIATLSAWLETCRPVDGVYPDRPCVYFITMTAAPYIKIGSAKRLAVRIAELQTGNPELLYPLAVIPGRLQEETQFHRALSPWRVRGEWFRRGKWVDVVMDCAVSGMATQDTIERIASDDDVIIERLDLPRGAR